MANQNFTIEEEQKNIDMIFRGVLLMDIDHGPSEARKMGRQRKMQIQQKNREKGKENIFARFQSKYRVLQKMEVQFEL